MLSLGQSQANWGELVILDLCPFSNHLLVSSLCQGLETVRACHIYSFLIPVWQETTYTVRGVFAIPMPCLDPSCLHLHLGRRGVSGGPEHFVC